MATYAPDQTISNARDLRKSLTPPEARLWKALRRRALDGLKFRRQHPIGPYVLDFYCPSLKLAVEVDGHQHAHEEQIDRDRARDLWLQRRGIVVLRIPAWTIRDELELALTTIRSAALGLAAASETPIGPSGHFPLEGEEKPLRPPGRFPPGRRECDRLTQGAPS